MRPRRTRSPAEKDHHRCAHRRGQVHQSGVVADIQLALREQSGHSAQVQVLYDSYLTQVTRLLLEHVMPAIISPLSVAEGRDPSLGDRLITARHLPACRAVPPDRGGTVTFRPMSIWRAAYQAFADSS